MSKISLNSVDNLANQTGAAAAINANSTAISTAFDNTLSRDGTAPNSMLAPLDMNSQRIINLPAPVDNNDAVRLTDLVSATGNLSGADIAAILAAPGYAAAAAASATAAAGYVGAATQAPKWTTGRTITITGAVTGTSGTFDGTANLSFSVALSGAQIATSLGYTPARIDGPNFTVNPTFSSQRLMYTAIGTTGNAGRWTFGTAAPGTLDIGEFYGQYT